MTKYDQATFDKFSDGQYQIWQPATHKDYEPVVALIKFIDDLRKKKA